MQENLTFDEHSNEQDKERKKMSIIVNNKTNDNDNKTIEKEESLKKSKYIISPKC